MPTLRRRSTTLILSLASLLSSNLTACATDEAGAAGTDAQRSQFALSIGAGSLSMAVGESIQLHTAVSAGSTRLYTLAYETSDSAIATVSAEGIVTAVAAGAATIKVVATLLDTGESASTTVAVVVAGAGAANGSQGSTPPTPTPTPTPTSTPTPTPVPTPPNGVEWTGVTAAMWAEIDAQRASFGDPNDCQARVRAIPTSGGVTLSPGADINAALSMNDVVFLTGGTYASAGRIVVPAGKKLVGVSGQSVTIDASRADIGVILQNDTVLSNVIVDGSLGDGVLLYDPSINGGSTGALIHQVSSRRSGLDNPTSDNSAGLRITQDAANNCVVSFEASDTWNELGAPNDHGGNADGIDNSFGAHHNTFIDVHAYRNGDDGFDMWQGGVAFFYFSNSHDNGKTTGKTLTGDGNGVKLGIGSVSHRMYKVRAYDNKADGFDLNGNTVQPTLVQCTASGNGGEDYAGVTH